MVAGPLSRSRALRVASDGRERAALDREPLRPSAGRGQAAGRWPARVRVHAAAPSPTRFFVKKKLTRNC
jgi:hypothetical protein